MKSSSPSYTTAILAFIVMMAVNIFITLVLVSIVAYLLFGLLGEMKIQDRAGLTVCIALPGILVSTLVSRGVAVRMLDESLSFMTALRATLWHYFMYSSYIPLVGSIARRYFGVDKNPFTQSKEKKEANQQPEPTRMDDSSAN